MLAERNPGLAARTIARAVKPQSTGGKLSLLREFVVKLAEGEGPDFIAAVRQEMAALASDHDHPEKAAGAARVPVKGSTTPAYIATKR